MERRRCGPRWTALRIRSACGAYGHHIETYLVLLSPYSKQPVISYSLTGGLGPLRQRSPPIRRASFFRQLGQPLQTALAEGPSENPGPDRGPCRRSWALSVRFIPPNPARTAEFFPKTRKNLWIAGLIGGVARLAATPIRDIFAGFRSGIAS